MSKHGYRVYGSGHLANTLTCALYARRLTVCMDEFGGDVLAFVAQDVLDHSASAQLDEVARLFARALQGHHYIVVLSQVPPGWTRAAGGGRHGVYYQLDNIIVRRAVARMTHPEQFVVGCRTPDEELPLPYQEYLSAYACPILQMSYESAELAKCAINYHLAVQVRLANELQAAADAAKADYQAVARALAGDSRIGRRTYLEPGQINQHLRRDVETVSALVRSGVDA